MKYSRILRMITALSVAALLFCSSAVTALACTGFYFGKDTTNDGTTIWGRTEDISASSSKLYYVQPAKSYAPGDVYRSCNGFEWPYPAQTLRYTLTPDSIYNYGEWPHPYAECGMNEKNVALSSTVSIRSLPAIVGNPRTGIVGVDPLIRDGTGLAEQDLNNIVLMQATSARHAIEVVAEIIDTVGNAESNGFTVCDPKETWYMELLSGHQYVAVKAPPGKIAVSPNIMMMGAVDVTDRDNVLASQNLIEVAREAGTLVEDEKGFICVAKSYAGPSASVEARLYDGYEYLKGIDAANALVPGHYDYFISPRAVKKYSLYEALRLMGYKTIGRAATIESHAFQTRHDMPEALATVMWLALGPGEFNVYFPYYGNLITDTFKNYYEYDSPRDDPDYRSMYWLLRDIYNLCANDRVNVAPNVSALFERYQKALIDQQKTIDAEMVKILAYSRHLAEEKATALSMAASERAFEIFTALREEILAYNADPEGEFVPSALSAPLETNYTFAAVEGGTGLPVALKDAATGITIEGEIGALDYGTELIVELVSAADLPEGIIAALEGIATRYLAFDLKLLLDGEEVQPRSVITLSFPIPEGFEPADLELYRVEDGKLVKLAGEIDGDFYRVKLDHLSIYILAQAEAEEEAEEKESIEEKIEKKLPATDSGAIYMPLLAVLFILFGYAALKRNRLCKKPE